MPLVRKASQVAPPAGSPDRADALRALGSGPASARWSAARALADFVDTAPELGRALAAETDQRVRAAIFTSLIHFGDAASVQAVVPYLGAPDANLRSGALDALRAMPAAMGAYLAGLLRDPDPNVRLLACELTLEVPSPATAMLLAEVLEHDPSVNVCAAALDALGEIGGPDVLPAMACCAERFADQPFIRFSVDTVRTRIERSH